MVIINGTIVRHDDDTHKPYDYHNGRYRTNHVQVDIKCIQNEKWNITLKPDWSASVLAFRAQRKCNCLAPLHNFKWEIEIKNCLRISDGAVNGRRTNWHTIYKLRQPKNKPTTHVRFILMNFISLTNYGKLSILRCGKLPVFWLRNS